MKFLILLFIVASCGKNDQPHYKDQTDADGDQRANYLEFKNNQKYFAQIRPVQATEAQINFEAGSNVIKRFRVDLTNYVELKSFARDLLVKNINVSSLNEHFSEFNTFRVKEKNVINLDFNSTHNISLTFSKKLQGDLYYVSSDGKELLTSWTDRNNLILDPEKLENLLRKKAHLVVYNFSGKSSTYGNSLEEDVRMKTRQVIYSDGEISEVFYISKEIALEGILSKLGISNYKHIDDEKIMTKTSLTEKTEWWIREINQGSTVIVRDSLNNLAKHYLQSLERSVQKVSRVNGSIKQQLTIFKQPSAKMLLKIRAMKLKVNYKEHIENKRKPSGGRENAELTKCTLHYRDVTSISEEKVPATDLINELILVNEQNKKVPFVLRESNDEKGAFFEIEVNDASETIKISLNSISQKNHVQFGLFKVSSCDFHVIPKIKPNLKALESSLELSVEAFVEKI